jgi:hypothetical protein
MMMMKLNMTIKVYGEEGQMKIGVWLSHPRLDNGAGDLLQICRIGCQEGCLYLATYPPKAGYVCLSSLTGRTMEWGQRCQDGKFH